MTFFDAKKWLGLTLIIEIVQAHLGLVFGYDVH